jgi:hypothetical protein
MFATAVKGWMAVLFGILLITVLVVALIVENFRRNSEEWVTTGVFSLTGTLILSTINAPLSSFLIVVSSRIQDRHRLQLHTDRAWSIS